MNGETGRFPEPFVDALNGETGLLSLDKEDGGLGAIEPGGNILDLLLGRSLLVGEASLIGEAMEGLPRTDPRLILDAVDVAASSFFTDEIEVVVDFGAGSLEKRGMAVAFIGLVCRPG